MSVKSRHLLLLFLQNPHPDLCISTSIAQSSRCLCGRSPFQLLATSFIQLPGLHQSHSGDLSGDPSRAQTSGSLRGPNPDCRVDGRAVPNHCVFLCKQTFWYPKTSIIWNAWCPTPSCAAISLTVVLWSCLMSFSTFCLLHSAAAVLGQPQYGWSTMSVFPSFTHFTHFLTLLPPT